MLMIAVKARPMLHWRTTSFCKIRELKPFLRFSKHFTATTTRKHYCNGIQTPTVPIVRAVLPIISYLQACTLSVFM
jgi:hypothetical protein